MLINGDIVKSLAPDHVGRVYHPVSLVVDNASHNLRLGSKQHTHDPRPVNGACIFADYQRDAGTSYRPLVGTWWQVDPAQAGV